MELVRPPVSVSFLAARSVSSIAAHNGCNQSEVAKAVGMSPSSVSRCVTWLGPKHRLEHRSGLLLIRREQDPKNYKAYKLYLTPKGEQFVNLVEQQLTMPIKEQKS